MIRCSYDRSHGTCHVVDASCVLCHSAGGREGGGGECGCAVGPNGALVRGSGEMRAWERLGGCLAEVVLGRMAETVEARFHVGRSAACRTVGSRWGARACARHGDGGWAATQGIACVMDGGLGRRRSGDNSANFAGPAGGLAGMRVPAAFVRQFVPGHAGPQGTPEERDPNTSPFVRFPIVGGFARSVSALQSRPQCTLHFVEPATCRQPTAIGCKCMILAQNSFLFMERRGTAFPSMAPASKMILAALGRCCSTRTATVASQA